MTSRSLKAEGMITGPVPFVCGITLYSDSEQNGSDGSGLDRVGRHSALEVSEKDTTEERSPTYASHTKSSGSIDWFIKPQYDTG